MIRLAHFVATTLAIALGMILGIMLIYGVLEFMSWWFRRQMY